MKTSKLWVLPAALLFTACGGGDESSESDDSTESAPVETAIDYAPFMTTEEVRDSEPIEDLEAFNAVEDKSTVVRYLSSTYREPFPTELLDAYNLQVLSLSLSGELPEEMGTFQNMTTLILGGEITTIPESVGELEHLKVVSFETCKDLDLEQALGVLANCPNLEYLSFGYMGLTEIPANIGDLKTLKHLRIGNNELATLPESLYTLPALEHLRLSGNEGLDKDAIVNSAQALPALSTLWLQYCGFSTLPAVLGDYPALTSVHWKENWDDIDSDQIVALCEKEGERFPNIDVSWSNMSGMLYDIY